MKLSSLVNLTIAEAKRKSGRRTKFQTALAKINKSQADAADDVGVDESTISRYKTGVRDPSLSSLKRLSKQGFDVVDVFGIKGGESDNPVRAIRPTRKVLRRRANKLLKPY